MKQELDSYIKGLDTQIRDLTAKRDAAAAFKTQLTGAAASKPKANGAAPKKASTPKKAGTTNVVHRGAGYVSSILPFLNENGPSTTTQMHNYLKTLPGLAEVGYNSFASTLATEVKKGDNSRIVKQGNGVYDLRLRADQAGEATLTQEPASNAENAAEVAKVS